MLAKKVAALVQRHRMREHLANVFKLDPRRGDQVVRDSQPHFGVNKNVALQEEIKMLTDGTGQRVLHWNNRSCGAAGIQRVKDLDGRRTRQHISATHKLQCRLMAERSHLALNGDFHGE